MITREHWKMRRQTDVEIEYAEFRELHYEFSSTLKNQIIFKHQEQKDRIIDREKIQKK